MIYTEGGEKKKKKGKGKKRAPYSTIIQAMGEKGRQPLHSRSKGEKKKGKSWECT